MAIYHAQIKSFSRGKGDSSIAAAAYRAGIDLTDTKTREVYRFSARHGVVSHHMLAPPGAPDWCKDVRVFWDCNEQFEARQNARLGRECEVSLPNELSKSQREALALALGKMLVDRYGVVVLAAIHGPTREGDSRNHHVHLLMSARQVGAAGLGERAGAAFDARGGKGAEELRDVRKIVANMINAHLHAAGIKETVDHRSLHDQAQAAKARGDLAAFAALSRQPGKHNGRAITALLRAVASDPLKREGQDMQQTIDKAAREGRLLPLPPQHSQEVAHKDRARETGSVQAKVVGLDVGASASAFTVPKIVRGRLVAPWLPSAAARHLSQHFRLARLRGQGSEVLDAEAKLIEEWLESQVEAAKVALASLQTLPGVQVEKPIIDAVASYSRRRAGLYAQKDFFFEDTEELTFKIQEYAAAIREPHEMRERVRVAMAKLAETSAATTRAGGPSISSARRALSRAATGVSAKAKRANEVRVRQARQDMTDAVAEINRKFHISAYDPLGLDKDPFQTEKEKGSGGERKSDSNRQELRPNLRPRI